MIKTEESFGIVPVRMPKSSAPLFLLIHQRIGHWAFPKGHIEEGEEPLEAAQRELVEETGIKDVQIVNGYTYIQNYTFEQEGSIVQKTVTFFLGLVTTQEVSIKEDEVQNFGWYEYKEALERLTYQDSKNLITDVHARLNQLSLRTSETSPQQP